MTPISADAPYDQKFELLDRNMRWEVADLLRARNLAEANRHLPFVQPSRTLYTRIGKRILDGVIAAIALLVALPINALIAVITLMTLGRPLLFHQHRIGKHGKLFTLTKFRNMRGDVDQNGHPLPGHLRVTRFGKVIRKTSMDELLNFWSILKGDMSLIGPRPLLPEYHDRFSDRHQVRHSVKPGLECPLRAPLDRPMAYDDQFENDVWYASNVSLRTDLVMIYRLFATMFDRKQVAIRGGASRGAFMGYDLDGSVIDSHNVPSWALDEILDRHQLLEPSWTLAEILDPHQPLEPSWTLDEIDEILDRHELLEDPLSDQGPAEFTPAQGTTRIR
jgi:lipopolysaccharide/colanic/teichoic acid biosynthesis glycosyltransferase